MMKYLKVRSVQKRQIHGLRRWIVSCVNIPQICYFCTALISNYFVLKIYTPVSYTFMYICIFFQIFLKRRNMNFDEFLSSNLKGSSEPELQKAFPRVRHFGSRAPWSPVYGKNRNLNFLMSKKSEKNYASM